MPASNFYGSRSWSTARTLNSLRDFGPKSLSASRLGWKQDASGAGLGGPKTQEENPGGLLVTGHTWTVTLPPGTPNRQSVGRFVSPCARTASIKEDNSDNNKKKIIVQKEHLDAA